jgi:hypothetical protein
MVLILDAFFGVGQGKTSAQLFSSGFLTTALFYVCDFN